MPKKILGAWGLAPNYLNRVADSTFKGIGGHKDSMKKVGGYTLVQQTFFDV